MTEQIAWHLSCDVMFLCAAWQLRKGLVGIAAWPCLMFVIGYSGNVLSYPLALAGWAPYEWMVGLPAATEYGFVISISMMSFWVGHMLIRGSVGNWKWLRDIPPLSISAGRGIQVCFVVSAFGPVLSITMAALGFHGYFTAEAFLYEPPPWLDLVRTLLTVQLGLLLLILLHEFQAKRQMSAASIVLTVMWILAGFVSGFKTQVVVPGLFVAIAAWMTSSLRLRYVLLIPLVIVLSYLVIEPLRELRRESTHDNALEALDELARAERTNPIAMDDLWEQFVLRSDYGKEAIGALIANDNGNLVQYKERLDESYRLIPMLAFIPRSLWPDKPLADLGRELSIDLNKMETNSVTPSSPVASYVWGGTWGLIANSVIYGIAVTICGAVVLRYSSSPIRYLPALLCAMALSLGDTVMAFYYVACIRYSLIIFVFYIFLARSRARAGVRQAA